MQARHEHKKTLFSPCAAITSLLSLAGLLLFFWSAQNLAESFGFRCVDHDGFIDCFFLGAEDFVIASRCVQGPIDFLPRSMMVSQCRQEYRTARPPLVVSRASCTRPRMAQLACSYVLQLPQLIQQEEIST